MNSEKPISLLITLFDLRVGGISNFILQTVPSLISLMNVQVVYFGPKDNMLKSFIAANIRTTRIKYYGTKDIFRAGKELSLFIDKNAIDVVSTHLTIDKMIATVAKRYSRFKVISTLHSVNNPYISRNIKYIASSKFEDYFHNKVADLNLAVSKAALISWQNYRRLPRENSKVLYSGIEELNCTHKSAELPDRDITIFITACRFTKEKGLERLIEYLFELNKQDQSWEFWILGLGPLESDLKEKVNSLNLSNKVVFKGYQTDLCPFYAKAHFFVNSSYHEAFPISILEAMSLGMPVIGSDVGGIPEIIDHDECGFLVDFNNMQESVSILRHCIAMNDEKLQKLRESARKRFVSNFSISNYVDNFEKELRSLIIKK